MTKFRDALINRYQKLGSPDTTFTMACRLLPETALNDKILMKALEGYEAEKEEEAMNAPLMVCRLNEDGKTYWTERK